MHTSTTQRPFLTTAWLRYAQVISLLAIIVIGFIGYLSIQHSQQVITKIIHKGIQFDILSNSIYHKMLLHRRYEKDFLLNVNNPVRQQAYVERFNNVSSSLKSRLIQLQSLITEDEIFFSNLENVTSRNTQIVNSSDEVYLQYLRQSKQASEESLLQRIATIDIVHQAYIEGFHQVVNAMSQDKSITPQKGNEMMFPFKSDIYHLEFAMIDAAHQSNIWLKEIEKQAQDELQNRREQVIVSLAISVILLFIVGIITELFRRRTDASDKRYAALQANVQRMQKLEAIGTLAGGVAHDFNNILYGAIGFTQLAIDELEKDHPAISYLDEVKVAHDRASSLVKQILTFSRQQKLEKTPVNLASIVEESVSLVKVNLSKNIEIKKSIQEDCNPVLADATQMHQVIVNLLTNAAQAIEQETGKIEIELKEFEFNRDKVFSELSLNEGKYNCLKISDTGKGIEKKHIERIFDPFFTTKEVGKGTGLGLSTSLGIIKDCNGDILVESEREKGTSFFIYLPQLQ